MVQIPARAEICVKISVPPTLPNHLSYDECTDRTLLYGWEDEPARERTGHLPSYAEAKKMKQLSLHFHGCRTDSFRDCLSLLLQFFVRACLDFTEGLCLPHFTLIILQESLCK